VVGNAILVVISLIFALGLGEGAARILGYMPYAPANPNAEKFAWFGLDPVFAG
jgi:hypothetical protein